MKFKAQVGGLISGIEPMLAISSKGVQKDYPKVGLVTLQATIQSINAIVDGGYVSGINEIDNPVYNLDYECVEDGMATVVALDLMSSLKSFRPSEIVTVELRNNADGREMVITQVSDTDEVQTLPVNSVDFCSFSIPEIDKKTKSLSIQMQREVFLKSANKIIFAHGDQEMLKNFTYWLLRATGPDSLRFAAGTGNRFAVVDLEGKGLSDVKNDTKFYFPNNQTQPVLNVLSEAKGSMVKIESKERLIVITCDKISICLASCDPGISWPDENRFLQRASKFNFTTKVSSWRNAVKGIMATNNASLQKQNKIHNCYLNIDLDKKFIQAKTDVSNMKALRKVAIDDIATNEDKREICINCASCYVNEIISKGSDDDYLQFEIDDESKPVIVRYYAGQSVGDPLSFKKPSTSDCQERYSIFFSTIKPN
jgi:hypothetical protein